MPQNLDPEKKANTPGRRRSGILGGAWLVLTSLLQAPRTQLTWDTGIGCPGRGSRGPPGILKEAQEGSRGKEAAASSDQTGDTDLR